MNTYVTGSTIRQLREAKGMTQAELAGMLSDIKWENLEEAEVSEADKNHPLLKDVKPLRAEDL